MKQRIIAIYTAGKGITGQMAATHVLLDILRKEQSQISEYRLPTLNRNSGNRFLAKFGYLFRLLLAWLRLPAYLFKRFDYIYLNVGQTMTALLRDLVPFYLLTQFNRAQGCVSMHGNVFMDWEKGDLCSRLLSLIISKADHVTVLGTNQREKLISLGVTSTKIVVLPNTCDLPPLDKGTVHKKHQEAIIRIVFLSNLIDSKGYPEFLEAMELLAQETSRSIEITLCGRLMQSDFGTRFSSQSEARQWIEQKIDSINSHSPNVRVRWIEGAFGDEKKNLLYAAHIFIFPSQYRVEAQPIVLLEAMASGLAIITSRVGEIPETMQETGVLISKVNACSVYEATRQLVEYDNVRLRNAINALQLFNERYDLNTHKLNWLSLFEKRNNGHSPNPS